MVTTLPYCPALNPIHTIRSFDLRTIPVILLHIRIAAPIVTYIPKRRDVPTFWSQSQPWCRNQNTRSRRGNIPTTSSCTQVDTTMPRTQKMRHSAQIHLCTRTRSCRSKPRLQHSMRRVPNGRRNPSLIRTISCRLRVSLIYYEF